MKPLLLILFLPLAGCASLKPSVYLGAQSVAAYDRVPTPQDQAGYVNLIWDLGHGFSFQVEPIVPFTQPGKPLLRLAVDKKVW